MIESYNPFLIQCEYPTKNEQLHRHAAYIEMIIVLSGTGIYKVNQEAYFIKKGDVFVISMDTLYVFEQTSNLCICRIMFHPEKLQSLHSDVKKLPGYQALFKTTHYFIKENHFKSRMTLSIVAFEHINGIITGMIQEYTDQNYGWKDMIDASFQHLVVYLSRSYLPGATDNKSGVIYIDKSVSYIEEHFKDNMTMKELAAKSHMSVRHFSRVFRANYHTSPGNYIILLRLEYACMLLRTSEWTISEVATHSGFNDSNYFCRQFHKRFDMTPKEYRLNQMISAYSTT